MKFVDTGTIKSEKDKGGRGFSEFKRAIEYFYKGVKEYKNNFL